MRKAITLLLAALLVSGCVANWKSNKTGPRWHEGPPYDSANGPATTP